MKGRIKRKKAGKKRMKENNKKNEEKLIREKGKINKETEEEN